MSKGWLDNYGKKENANDSSVSLPEGFVGMGNNTKGRNYSPAWGGQFQDGGNVSDEDYNMKRALELGYTADESGHWPSVDDETGEWLKSKKHHTRGMEIMAYELNPELRNKYNLIENEKGKLQYVPKLQKIEEYQMGGNVYPVNYVPQAQEGKTMFKKPSILQQEYIDPIYSYSERTKLYPGEEKAFKERPDVAGMAAEDNRVIINPYSPISKEMKDLVRTNETARLAMRGGYPRPDFELTPKQQEFFNTVQNGKPYSEDLQDIKETIAARVMTGDDSAQDYTKEQEMYADKLFDVLKKSKEYATGMSGMMKSKIGMGNAFEHPAIKRMSQAMPKTGMTPEGTGTHYMSSVDNYAVPELQDLGEEELTLVDPDSRSREAIRFNSPEEANYFAKNYKDVAPMTNIFGDLNSFQGGGSIPGTQGFTYARTKGIPSNGPYAKKTMASAQNGVDMYDNPLIARMVNNANIDRSYYDPRLNTMNMGSDYNMWRDEETGEPLTGDDLKYQQDKMLAHENYHAMQHKEGRDNYDIAHSTDNEQWARMQKRPEVMSTDAVWNNFYNRSAIENIQDYANKINEVPEARLINQQLLFDKVLDRERYNNPSNLEGEAKFYEDTGVTFQNGGEMRYYQNGLDWKPKGMKDGGWLSKYEEGGIIKDDLGQWAYPGEITEISGDTMATHGYGDIPLYVVPDKGKPRMVQPNTGIQKFPGAKKFTEYPMAKNGLRQEQKGLVNLDNLLNFTNYNKPQPCGWLSKYE